MSRFIGVELNNKSDKTVRAPEPYNLFDHEPSFRNTYGWSISVDKHDYHPLDHSDIGVYLVNLTAVRFCSSEPSISVVEISDHCGEADQCCVWVWHGMCRAR